MIPDDIWPDVFSCFDSQNLCKTSSVCREWRSWSEIHAEIIYRQVFILSEEDKPSLQQVNAQFLIHVYKNSMMNIREMDRQLPPHNIELRDILNRLNDPWKDDDVLMREMIHEYRKERILIPPADVVISNRWSSKDLKRETLEKANLDKCEKIVFKLQQYVDRNLPLPKPIECSWSKHLHFSVLFPLRVRYVRRVKESVALIIFMNVIQISTLAVGNWMTYRSCCQSTIQSQNFLSSSPLKDRLLFFNGIQLTFLGHILFDGYGKRSYHSALKGGIMGTLPTLLLGSSWASAIPNAALTYSIAHSRSCYTYMTHTWFKTIMVIHALFFSCLYLWNNYERYSTLVCLNDLESDFVIPHWLLMDSWISFCTFFFAHKITQHQIHRFDKSIHVVEAVTENSCLNRCVQSIRKICSGILRLPRRLCNLI